MYKWQPQEIRSRLLKRQEAEAGGDEEHGSGPESATAAVWPRGVTLSLVSSSSQGPSRLPGVSSHLVRLGPQSVAQCPRALSP